MSMMRRIFAGGVAVSILLAVAGCGGTKTEEKPAQPSGGAAPAQQDQAKPKQVTKVRFSEVIHSLFYLPEYVAEAKGFFKDEGIDLDTTTAQGSDKGAAAILAGTADVALVGPETTVFIYNQDTPVKVKLFAQLTAKDGSFMMARKPSGSFKWEETKGKTIIGWRTGSEPQMVETAVLKKAGLTAGKDVNYVTNIASTAMAGAFQSGQGEYIQLYEPVVSQFEKDGTAKVVASLGVDGGSLPVTGYLASEKYIADHPDVIQHFTNAIYRAMLYVQKTDPAIVAKEVAPLFDGTDVSLIESSIKRYQAQDTWAKTPVAQQADIDKMQNLLVDSGVLEAGKKAPFDKIVINTFAEQAVKTVK